VRVTELVRANRRRTPAIDARRCSSARAPVCDQARPRVTPSMTQERSHRQLAADQSPRFDVRLIPKSE
jgi:hypothetical protein